MLAIGQAILLVAAVGAIFLGVGFTVVRMFWMCLEREISGGELLLWLFVYLAAISMAFTTWNTPLFAPVILLCLFLAIAYPLGNYLIEIRGRQRMRIRDIAVYLQAAEENPDNPYPLRRLGDIFFKSQDYGLAVKYYKQYLKWVKDSKIARRIERARQLIRQSPQQTRICSNCGAVNPKTVAHCIECGGAMPGVWELLEPFRGRRGISILLWATGVAMAIGLGIALLQLLTEQFAPLLAYILVPFMFLVAVTCFFIYLYIRISG